MAKEKPSLCVGLIPSPYINMSMTMSKSVSLNADQLREKFLQCHVCFEDYNEEDKHPRLLPCLHTFCYQCVNKLKKDHCIECPTCRSQHKLRSEDLRELPKDNTRRDLMDFVRVQREPTDVFCQVCSENVPATHRCKQCAEFLCDGCKEAHRKTTVTRGHELVTLEKLRKEQSLEAFCHPQKCMQHDGGKLELYCSKPECQKPICVVCALVEHKEPQGHKIDNANDVCEKRKLEIVKQMETLHVTGESVASVIRDVDKETVAVSEKGRDVEQEIDAAFDNYIKIIEKRRSELKENVSSHVNNKTKVLDSQMNSLKFQKTRIDEAMHFSDQALAYTNASAFLQIEKTIAHRLHGLIHQRFDKVPHETAAIGFNHKGLLGEIQKDVVSMAHVWASSVYPPKTMIEQEGGPGALENEIVTFFAMLYNYQDQKADDGIGNLSAVVKNPKGEEMFARIDDRHAGAEGRFRVTCVPFSTGSHTLEVRIMGRPVGSLKFDVDSRIDLGVSKISPAVLQHATLTEFSLDRSRAHRDVTVSPDGKTFLNSAAGLGTSSKDALQKYKGAMSLEPLKEPGSHYYEFNVRYKIRRPLEKCNLVFEIGLARREAIDSRHHVEGQQFAWSLIGAHHNECDAICLHIAHGNQCIFHDTLSPNENGATMSRTFGFMVDTDKKEWKIYNSQTGEQVCVIDGVDASEPLFPVVAGYNPYQVEVTMNLRTGKSLKYE